MSQGNINVWDAALNRITGADQKNSADTLDKLLRDLGDFVAHGVHPGEIETITLADADALMAHLKLCADLHVRSLARIRELVDLGYELANLLEGVTQDERDRIETTAGILQSEWFRRQQSLLHRAHEVLWPDGLPNPHSREPFPAPTPIATGAAK